MDNANIKKNIYKKRLEKGYSQSEIASKMNISQTSYQKIEKGETSLVSERLSQIASILDLSETELVFGYLPDDKVYSKKIKDLQEESLLKESSINENFSRILSEKDNRIKDLEETIKDKNEIISLLREKLEAFQK